MLNKNWLILAFWPRRGSVSWSPAFHSRDQGSFAGHLGVEFMVDRVALGPVYVR